MQVDDIILKLRRTVRNKRPVVVTVLSFNESDYVRANSARYHYFRNGIAELADQRGAEMIAMPQGELVVIRDGSDEIVSADARILFEDQEDAWTGNERPDQFIENYFLPDDYVDLRQRLEQHVRPRPGNRNKPPDEARTEPPVDNRLKGPLTPRTLAEIQDVLDSVDLGQFVQRQAIYRRESRWAPVYVEHFTSMADLRSRLFPDVTFDQDVPLFAEFCRHLDRLMLINLLLNRPFRNQMIGINIEWTTQRTAEFHRLEQLSSAERRRIVLELRWSDYLRDLETGSKLVHALKSLGFAVAVDRIGFDILPIIDFSGCQADYLKIIFEKDKLPLLAKKTHRDALEQLDREKLILCSCDDPLALSLGQRTGITKYQGWSISRLARQERSKAA